MTLSKETKELKKVISYVDFYTRNYKKYIEECKRNKYNDSSYVIDLHGINSYDVFSNPQVDKSLKTLKTEVENDGYSFETSVHDVYIEGINSRIVIKICW